MPLSPGDTFDRYVLEDSLGRGGMGEVFRARDTRLRRKVALKVLWRTPDEGAARLLREARAAAAIDHPCVVAIYDVGEIDGTAFIAMELVGGTTLRPLVGDGAIPVERRIRWLVDVARALAAAHRRGLVHRDVKPENVMVRPDDSVKVLDFGIARRFEPVDEPSSPSSVKDVISTLTAPGTVMGTPRYMAPEQLWGQPVDGRADQFAWGVIAYELLSGASPWGSVEGAAELVTTVLTREPAPLGGDVPRSVADAVLRALAKSPDDRFPSMDELAAAIEGAAAIPPARASIPPNDRASPAILGPGPDTPAAAPATSEDAILLPTPVEGREELTTSVAPKRGRVLRAALAIAVGAAAVVAIGWALSAAPRGPKGKGARPAPTALTDLPVPHTSPEAEAAYRAGLQALRDASILSAVQSFDRAVAADPRLAPAHMRLALWKSGVVLGEARAHYQTATDLRSTLDARDRAMLHALEPKVLVSPQDLLEGERRAMRAAAEFPGDAELALLVALYRQEQGRTGDAADAASQALALDPRFALAFWTRGGAEDLEGRVDDAMRSYDRCLELAPNAASCLRSRARRFEEAGQCDRLEAEARRMVAVEPTGYRAYEFLSGALYALGKRDAGRAALEQRWSLLEPRRRSRGELHDRASVALLGANLAEAETHALALASEVAGVASEEERARPLRLLLELYGEVGDDERAAVLAEAFLGRRDAWVRGYARPEEDVTPAALTALERGGMITREALRARRDAWIATLHSGVRMKRGEPWLVAYGRLARDRQDAEEALAALPSFLPIARDGAAALGHVHLLAGRAGEALPLLEEGTRHCGVLRRPVELTLVHAWLGEAREAKGDARGACKAYHAFNYRWWGAQLAGRKPRRSRTAERVERSMKRLDCDAHGR